MYKIYIFMQKKLIRILARTAWICKFCTWSRKTILVQVKCWVPPPFRCSVPVRPIVKIFVAEFKRIRFATELSSRNFELGPQNRTGMHVKQPKKTPWNNTYVFSKNNSAKFSRISRLYIFLRNFYSLRSTENSTLKSGPPCATGTQAAARQAVTKSNSKL